MYKYSYNLYVDYRYILPYLFINKTVINSCTVLIKYNNTSLNIIQKYSILCTYEQFDNNIGTIFIRVRKNLN